MREHEGCEGSSPLRGEYEDKKFLHYRHAGSSPLRGEYSMIPQDKAVTMGSSPLRGEYACRQHRR